MGDDAQSELGDAKLRGAWCSGPPANTIRSDAERHTPRADLTKKLLAALDAREPVRLSLTDIPAHDVLSILATDGASFHVRITSLECLIDLEIGNGIVMGARAQCAGDVLQGRAAYVLLRRVRTGSVAVEPKRFLSMANILEPICALPDLTRPTSAPPPAMEADTVEVPALRAQPIDAPDVHTEEVAIPSESKPPPAAAPKPRRARDRSAMISAIGVALSVWGIAAGAFGAWRVADEPVEVAPAPIAVGATLPIAPVIEQPIAIEHEAEQARETPEVDARELGRAARRYLRNGRARAALVHARKAAQMRRHAPYYQTLLGDAYAANGREAEARRAWRRAVRLRADYQPALERLAGNS
jgi:hypothetical protein